jgi:hypothetical protein
MIIQIRQQLKINNMRKIISLLICTGSCLVINAQIYLADNGLTASGTGISKIVSLGGTLNNAATSIDFGTSNTSSNFLFKKGTSNYFFIGNDGKIGIGTVTPGFNLTIPAGGKIGSGSNQLLYLPDQTNFTKTLYIGDGGGSLSHSTGITGQYSLFVGMGAGAAMTTGYSNAGIGARALTFLTTGYENVAIGTDALYSLSSGLRNTALGKGAMQNATTASENTALGFNSLLNLTTGNFNVGMGGSSLVLNTTGIENQGVGFQTFYYNQTGSYNVGIGGNAGTGTAVMNVSNNVLIGRRAGYVIATGANNNIMIGYQAGDNVTTAASNILIGYNIDAPSATTNGQLSIGNLIFGKGIDGTGTTLSSGNVGIGTNAPNTNAKLDVSGNIFSSGKIAIGTTDMVKIGSYSLAVNGDAIFNKVKVKLYTAWPDYVFHSNYPLRPLSEVEKFIQQNKHLPEVPSAREAEENGLDLGDNQAILLKKIEELTLYLIEQNKKIEEQQKRIETLEKRKK